MTAPSELRPRTVGEILDAAFHVYRRRFGPLLLASTLLSLPTLVVAIVISHGAGAAFETYLAAFGDYVRASSKGHGPDMDALERVLALGPKVQVYAVLSSALQALSRAGGCLVGAFVVDAAVRGLPQPSTWTLVRGALPSLAAGTLVHVGVNVFAMCVGICPCLLPVSVAAGAVLAPAVAAIALERQPLGDAVRAWRVPRGLGWAPRALVLPFAAALDGIARAFSLSMHAMTLVRGSFCVFLVLTFVSILVSVVSLAGGLVAESFGTAYLLQHWAEVLFLPVIGVTFALWHVDLRVRREGADLA